MVPHATMRRSTRARISCSASAMFATVVSTTTASERGLDDGLSDDISAYGRPKPPKGLSGMPQEVHADHGRSPVLVFARRPRQLYTVMPEETLIVRGARE